VLYDSANGPAWVQVSPLTLNGKTEVLLCGGDSFDSNSYKKLAKASLLTAASLKRGADGILRYEAPGAPPVCAVPANLKIEKKQTYSAKELAQMAAIQGKVISKSNNGTDAVPPMMANTDVIFVAAADNELADYLRAARGNTVPLWREYLNLQPSGAHKQEANKALATLFSDAAEKDLAAFQNSHDYSTLAKARQNASEAQQSSPGFVRAQKVQFETESILNKHIQDARDSVKAFEAAIAEKKPGYRNLTAAQKLLEEVAVADATYLNLDRARGELQKQVDAVEKATASAEAQVAADPDKAYGAIGKYASLEPEQPRIAKIVDATFKYHRQRGADAAMQAKWEDAITEYKRALQLRADTPTQEALKSAENERDTIANRAAAEKAIADVQPLIAQKKFIEAYQTLENLPQGQRQFVSDQEKALEKDYATDLATRANQLTRLHLPIKGKADEDAVRQAYDYLEKASHFEMADSEAVNVKLELVSDKIAEYYLAQGLKAIEKPRGTGVALGYLLLLEGQRFKPDNEALRNAITRYAPEYDTRGKASIFVQFRDQTSRRDSLGFADQLSDTVASRLESSGTRGVKVLARNRDLTDPTTATGAQLANFLLSGDIVQHRVDKKVDTQKLVSHYRAGTREVKSAEWMDAKRQADDAQREYERIAEANKAVYARNKKKEIEVAQKMFDDQSKRVAAARSKLDAVQETQLQDIIQPYNYTKRVYAYSAVVEVAYKTSEMFAESAMQSDSVKLEYPKNASVLENVKPEDSDGIVEEGAAPDELQMFAETETKIQTDLMGKLNKWLGDLPGKVLADARERARSGDKEAAAAKYVIYLNSTPEKEMPERSEAINFLRDEFNITSLKPAQ
jgi:archaellum component FlaC